MTPFRLLLFICLLHAPILSGQPEREYNEQQSPQRALYAAFAKGDLMVAISPVNWRPGLCLAAARLTVGQTISLEVNLLARTDYVLVGSGATQRNDIDLSLRDSTGTIVATDYEKDGTPVIEFQPATSGSYTLQVHLVAGVNPSDFVAVSLLRKGGRVLPENEYVQISSTFFAAAAEIQSAYAGTSWQSRTGQWCLFGYSLAEGEGATLRRLQPGPGPSFFAAGGGDNLKNIDLYLANEAHRIVAKDNGPDAFPLVTYNCPAGAYFDLRIEVERARVATLLLVGVFQQ